MIPFTTCMKFNRKRMNRGSISKQQQQQHQFSQQQHSQQQQPQLVIIPADQSTLAPPNINLVTDIQSVPPFLQCPENRLLLTLRRSKAVQRSIHIDPIALLDYSYHGVTDRFLENASNWSFNSFTLDTLTGGHSLSSLLFYLFNKYNFISEFKLEIINVWKCFRLFENGYHDTNPYHNSVHAADVTQAMHCFIEEEKIGQHLTPMEKMCSLLAAVAHDLDHPGVNQHFLIATKSHLASLYNNLSVLESHHWRFAMSCLKESGIFSHFDDNQWSMVQFLLRSLILATDVTQQGNYLRRFRDALQKGTIKMTSPDDRLFVMQIALKCADLGNPGRPWVLSQRWTTQICNEFYRQGDYERQLKMKVTPIFDRRTASVARIQTDFYRNIVSPLYQLWDQFLGSKLSRRIIFNLKFNDSQWVNRLQKVNVKRRHSYETMNEKKRKAKDISKSLDDIMSIEEISLDELKDTPKVGSMDDKGLTCCLPILGSPCSSSSLTSSPKVTLEPGRFRGFSGLRKELAMGGDETEHIDSHEDDNEEDEDDEGERIHIGKKQCIGPNGCGTPSPPKEKRSSLPIISIQTSLGSSYGSSQLINLSSNCPNVFQSQSHHQLSNMSTSQTTMKSQPKAQPLTVTSSQPTTQSTCQPTNSQTSCSSSPSSHHHSRRHSYHNNNNNSNNNSNNNNSNNHHYRHHHHRHSIQHQPTITQPCLPYISVSQPISGSTDCTYGSDSGDTELLPEGSTYGTYTGLPRVVEQLMNYEQSIDKVTCLPHSFSTLPGYPTSTSSTNTPSYPSQSIVDTAQFCRGRRGSAPGCIGIYTGCELAAAALVFLHGTVSENEDSSFPEPDVSSHSAHLSSSLIHLKCPSLLKPSVTSSSQSSPSSSPPHISSYNLKQQASSSVQRPTLFLKTNNNNISNSNNDPDFISNNNCNNNNTDNNNGNNKGQKRRSSFPVCDSGHYFGYLATEGGNKLNSRKSPSSYLHGTAKSSSPRLKGRSLELLMSSLTAKTKLLTNQSCSLDSASECRSWLVKREERRGSIPQDILIHSLANYSANAL